MKGKRNYYGYSYKPRSAKYSNETVSFNVDLTDDVAQNTNFPHEQGHPAGIPIVAPTNVFGNRKVKNFTIKVTANGNDDQIFGALVYVPEGTQPSDMQVGGPAQSMYEPNQNVITTFVIPPNSFRNANGNIQMMSAPTQIVVNSKLARNLNTGDMIMMILSSPNGLVAGTGVDDNPEPVNISGIVNYAIKF